MKAAILGLGAEASRHGTTCITCRETNWGVVVTEAVPNPKSDALAETALRSLGLLVTLGGGALSLVVGPANTGHPTLTTFGLALAFAFVGFSIYRHANCGIRSEIRVDTRLEYIRAGSVNSNQDFSARRAYRADQIEGIFIRQPKTGHARLYLRLKRNAQEIAILEGEESELAPVLVRLDQMLFAKRGGSRRHQARTKGSRSSPETIAKEV